MLSRKCLQGIVGEKVAKCKKENLAICCEERLTIVLQRLSARRQRTALTFYTMEMIDGDATKAEGREVEQSTVTKVPKEQVSEGFGDQDGNGRVDQRDSGSD